MALLSINSLKAKTSLGVNDFEQAILSDVVLDLTFKIDIAKIAKNDNLDETIDYDTLANDLTTWLNSQQTKLLETLASDLVDFIFSKYQLGWIKLSITKVAAINNCCDVTITTEKNVDSS